MHFCVRMGYLESDGCSVGVQLELLRLHELQLGGIESEKAEIVPAGTVASCVELGVRKI